MTEITVLSLIESLKQEKILEYEIILVDNCSVDNTRVEAKKLAKLHPKIACINSDFNRGYAGGMNLGIQNAHGEIVFLLNNDLQFVQNWCTPIIKAFQRDSKVGAVGPLTNSAGNWQKINLGNRPTKNRRRVLLQILKKFQEVYFEVNTLGFFCVAIRREVFDYIGLLDENYGLGMFEDDDFCLRMRESSFKMLVSEESFVYHHGSASFKLLSYKVYSNLWKKNMLYFENKFKVRLLPNRAFIDYSYCHNREEVGEENVLLDSLRKKLRKSDWTKICLKEFLRILNLNGIEIALKQIRIYRGKPSLINTIIFLAPILGQKAGSQFKGLLSQYLRRGSNLSLSFPRNILRGVYVILHLYFWKVLRIVVLIRDSVRLLIDLFRKGMFLPSSKFIVFPQTVDFTFMKQRPQQLAVSFAEAGFFAIYFTTNSQSDRVVVFNWVDGRVLVLNYRFKILLRVLNLYKNTIFYCIWPTNHFYLEHFKPKKIVYDICDSLDLLKDDSGDRNRIMSLHAEMCKVAHLITYSASNLRDIIPDLFKDKCLYLPNAVSRDFINIASQNAPSRSKKSQVKLVYYGYVSKWVDFALLQKFANLQIVELISIFGSVDSNFEEDFNIFLDRNVKVTYYGEISNFEIAEGLHRFDIGLIPFLTNEITNSVSPVKLFEYAAGSLPTLTFHNGEIPHNHGLFSYRTHEEALALLQGILESRSIAMQNSLRIFSLENLWDHRVESVLKVLEDL
jgi:GT2 family glycosyltransferase